MPKKATPKPQPTPEPTPEAPAEPAKHYDWRDPEATFAEDDKSLDAELWRMSQRQDGKR